MIWYLIAPVADAKAAKMKAKLRSCHIVAQSMAKVAEINLKYGGQAALAVGNAALNDVATFVPVLAPLASKVLPDLAQGFAAGPQGIQNALGGLASAVGGALVGECAHVACRTAMPCPCLSYYHQVQ